MPARVGGICALLAFVTFTIGSIAGGLAQPDAYSFAKDDLSDLGAVTANSAWLCNQVTANLLGLLLALVGLALWRVLSPDILGRIGAAALVTSGISYFFDGIFRLDCRGIDAGCENVSWHSHAHKIESRISAVLLLGTPFILALAFRRNREWRGAWAADLARGACSARDRDPLLSSRRRRRDPCDDLDLARLARVRRRPAPPRPLSWCSAMGQ